MLFRQFYLYSPVESDKEFRARVSPYEAAVEHDLDRDGYSAPFVKLNISCRPDHVSVDSAWIVEGVADVHLARPFDSRLRGSQEEVRAAAGELAGAAVEAIEARVEWPDAGRFRELCTRLAAHHGPYVLELCRTKPRRGALGIVTWLRIDEDEWSVYHTGPGGTAVEPPVVVARHEPWGRPSWTFPVKRCVVRGDQIAYLRSDGSIIAMAPIEPPPAG